MTEELCSAIVQQAKPRFSEEKALVLYGGLAGRLIASLWEEAQPVFRERRGRIHPEPCLARRSVEDEGVPDRAAAASAQ